MTVPEHEPDCWPLLSFMFRRTTGELAVEHSTPLMIAVMADTLCVTAAHALDTGMVGTGDVGVVGEPPPPPPQAAPSRHSRTAALVFILAGVRIERMGKRRRGPRRQDAR